MSGHAFKPGLVCRAGELATLSECVESALAGKGCAVLVSGEAGIGKSRLCEEALAYAESKGATVARGWCVEGALEPLHPVREALSGLGMEHLLDDSPPPELLCLYLLDQGGVLVASASKSGGGVDADIFSGMLQAISNFAKDSLSPLGANQAQLGSISYGDFRITARSREGLTLASIVKGLENEALVAEMDSILAEHAGPLSGWTGNVADTKESLAALESLVQSGRYGGRHMVDDPGLRKGGLMSGILGGLSRAAARKPVVLYLDDLQWADPTTVSLVHYLARNAPTARLVLLGTLRPEDVAPADGMPHPLASAMKTMSREGVIRIVKLERFETDGSRELVESALSGSTLEEAFYARLQREGGGNPFYTLELLRLMTESGALAKDDGGAWRLAKSVGEIEMPESLADIVGRRLDRMVPGDSRLLSVAAVLGEEFSLAALAEVAGGDRMALAGRLDAIESGTGLVRSAAAGYRFDHSKVREAAYARMGASMRREMHRLAAEAIIRGGAAGRLSEIALHMHCSGDARAPVHLTAAARNAKSRFAIEEAEELYKLAAGHGPLDRDARRELGDCERHLGRYGSAMAAYETLLDGATWRERGALLTMMAEVRDLQSAWNDGVALGKEAFEILGSDGPSEEMTRVCHVLCHIYMRRGEMKEAEIWAMRQMDLALGAGNSEARAAAEHDLGTLCLQTRRFDEALTHLGAAAGERRKLGDLVGLGASLNNLGAAHHNRGNWEKAVEYYREALGAKRSISDMRGIASTAGNLGIVSKAGGDRRGALRYMEEALGIRKRIGDLAGQCQSMTGIGLMRMDELDFDKAESILMESVKLSRRIGDARDEGMASANLGDLYAQTGKLEAARRCLERGIEIGSEVGDGLMRLLCRITQAEVCLADGRLDEADAILSEAKPEADAMKADNLLADYHRARGRLLDARGEVVAARASFAESIAIFERLRDGFPLARAKRAYAALCGKTGDPETAGRVLREVLDFALASGAEKLVKEVEAEISHLS